MSAVHYAPRSPLHLLPGPDALPPGATCVGLIGVFASPAEAADAVATIGRRYGVPVVLRALTESGNLEEAARNLFTSLRELDAGDVPLILAAPPGGDEGWRSRSPTASAGPGSGLKLTPCRSSPTSTFTSPRFRAGSYAPRSSGCG